MLLQLNTLSPTSYHGRRVFLLWLFSILVFLPAADEVVASGFIARAPGVVNAWMEERPSGLGIGVEALMPMCARKLDQTFRYVDAMIEENQYLLYAEEGAETGRKDLAAYRGRGDERLATAGSVLLASSLSRRATDGGLHLLRCRRVA